MLWDIFCKVIDNHGDLGVCWRLCHNLAARGEQLRLWVDDASALAWMAPQTHPAIQVQAWSDSVVWPTPGEVIVEAFGCELPPTFITRMAAAMPPPAWINLEYLTAEPYAERCHTLPSPLLHGPGTGLVKHFFYPGFTPATGGLLRESDLAERQSAFAQVDRSCWLRSLIGLDVEVDMAAAHAEHWVSLFCYEPPTLVALLTRLAASTVPVRLWVTAGRAQAAVSDCVKHINATLPQQNIQSKLSISYLPYLTQTDFDHLLWACDVNFVRGEDSLVRAIWAGKPLVWHIYPQDDDAHHDKLNALLDTLSASPVLRAWHQAWNGLTTGAQATPLPPFQALLSDTTLPQARSRLMLQVDLTTQLQAFVAAKRRLKS